MLTIRKSTPARSKWNLRKIFTKLRIGTPVVLPDARAVATTLSSIASVTSESAHS